MKRHFLKLEENERYYIHMIGFTLTERNGFGKDLVYEIYILNHLEDFITIDEFNTLLDDENYEHHKNIEFKDRKYKITIDGPQKVRISMDDDENKRFNGDSVDVWMRKELKEM